MRDVGPTKTDHPANYTVHGVQSKMWVLPKKPELWKERRKHEGVFPKVWYSTLDKSYNSAYQKKFCVYRIKKRNFKGISSQIDSPKVTINRSIKNTHYFIRQFLRQEKNKPVKSPNCVKILNVIYLHFSNCI